MQRPFIFHDNVSCDVVISEKVRIFAASFRERGATLGGDPPMAERCEQHALKGRRQNGSPAFRAK